MRTIGGLLAAGTERRQAAMKRIGYDGFMTLECSLHGEDKHEFVPLRTVANDPAPEDKARVLVETARSVRGARRDKGDFPIAASLRPRR